MGLSRLRCVCVLSPACWLPHVAARPHVAVALNARDWLAAAPLLPVSKSKIEKYTTSALSSSHHRRTYARQRRALSRATSHDDVLLRSGVHAQVSSYHDVPIAGQIRIESLLMSRSLISISKSHNYAGVVVLDVTETEFTRCGSPPP